MSKEELAASHKAALRRIGSSLVKQYVVRILGGQSLMLGNAETNASPATFSSKTCYAYDVTNGGALVEVTTGATSGTLGATRLGACCPVMDYAQRRYELLGENTIFIQLAWSGSALTEEANNGLTARWDTTLGENGFMTSTNLLNGGSPMSPADRAGVVADMLSVVAVSPGIDISRYEFHWQQGHADASGVALGSITSYSAALGRVYEYSKSQYGCNRFLVWSHGYVKETTGPTQAELNVTHESLHPLQDAFVAAHSDVDYATLSYRGMLSGNLSVNGDGEWVSGGLDGFGSDGVHILENMTRAAGREAATRIATIDGEI